MMNWKGFWRKQWRPNWGTVLAFALRDWRRPWKIWVRIAGVPAETWIKNLQNINLEWYWYDNLLSVISEKYKLWNSSLCSSGHLPITFALVSQNILLCTLLSNIAIHDKYTKYRSRVNLRNNCKQHFRNTTSIHYPFTQRIAVWLV
jgi:hypothetical protein